jgi:hypothetical protein
MSKWFFKNQSIPVESRAAWKDAGRISKKIIS